jgi:hypothetical protein
LRQQHIVSFHHHEAQNESTQLSVMLRFKVKEKKSKNSTPAGYRRIISRKSIDQSLHHILIGNDCPSQTVIAFAP